jgi:hypothetical protein
VVRAAGRPSKRSRYGPRSTPAEHWEPDLPPPGLAPHQPFKRGGHRLDHESDRAKVETARLDGEPYDGDRSSVSSRSPNSSRRPGFTSRTGCRGTSHSSPSRASASPLVISVASGAAIRTSLRLPAWSRSSWVRMIHRRSAGSTNSLTTDLDRYRANNPGQQSHSGIPTSTSEQPVQSAVEGSYLTHRRPDLWARDLSTRSAASASASGCRSNSIRRP